MFVSYITYSIHFTRSHKIECLLISFSYSFQTEVRFWICPYISRHLLSLNPLQARCRRYSRGER
ncbi:hypothetical protein EI021_24905 [Escherichia coli]|nr:hypothetical protein [Escherichia coli]